MSSTHSSPFRSLAGIARTRRRTPEVERSTLVVCQVAQLTVAFPVEQVERVLPMDAPSAHPTVRLCGGGDSREDPARDRATFLPRRLTLRADSWTANLVVDHVYEVRAIETALVQAAGDAPPMASVVGQFTREGAAHASGQSTGTVWVVDVARLARTQSAQDGAPAASHDQ